MPALQRLWWKVFPPIEVRWTRDAIRTACQVVGTDFELRNRCLAELRDVERVLYSIRIEGHTPQTLAALLVANIASQMISTGRFHIYRGVLSPMGNALAVAWTDANRYLIHEGRFTVAEHNEDWRQLQQNIKNVG